MAKAPEVLAVVVETPLGAGEDFAGGNFEQGGLDETVLIFGGLVGQALEEAVGAPGEKEVRVVHVVQGVHGAAREKELGGGWLEANWFEWDTKGGIGIFGGEKGSCGQKKERKEADGVAGPGDRGDEYGNRHSCLRVSPILFHRRRKLANGCRLSLRLVRFPWCR